jgi:MFS family permease
VVAGSVQRRLGRRWAIGINTGVNAGMFAVTALTAHPWLVAPAIVVGDFGGPLWAIAVLSLQARLVPDGLRGRVGSAYRFVSFGAMALGAALGWIAAEVVGTRAVFAGCAVLTAAMLVPFARIVTERAMEGAAD